MSTPGGRGRSARQPGAGEAIAGAVLGLLWAFRTELVLLVVVPLSVWAGVTWLLLGCPDDRHLPAVVCSPAGHAAALHAGLITLGAIAVLLAIPRVRRVIGTAFGRARLRRHLHRAFAQLDVPALRERRIWLRRSVRSRAGWLVTVVLPGGACVDDLERNTERLAAALGLRSVTVTRHPGNAAWVRIRLDRLDPLATHTAFPWPAVNAETMSLWEPVPVAVDEHGETIALSLIEKNLLLGGEPGGGKVNYPGPAHRRRRSGRRGATAPVRRQTGRTGRLEHARSHRRRPRPARGRAGPGRAARCHGRALRRPAAVGAPQNHP